MGMPIRGKKTSLHDTDQLAPFGSLQCLRAFIDGHCLVQ